MSLTATLLQDYRACNPQVDKPNHRSFPLLSRVKRNWRKLKESPDLTDVDFKIIKFGFEITNSEHIEYIAFAEYFHFCIEAYIYQVAKTIERLVPSKTCLICTRVGIDSMQTSFVNGTEWDSHLLPLVGLEVGSCYYQTNSADHFIFELQVGFIEPK